MNKKQFEALRFLVVDAMYEEKIPPHWGHALMEALTEAFNTSGGRDKKLLRRLEALINAEQSK